MLDSATSNRPAGSAGGEGGAGTCPSPGPASSPRASESATARAGPSVRRIRRLVVTSARSAAEGNTSIMPRRFRGGGAARKGRRHRGWGRHTCRLPGSARPRRAASPEDLAVCPEFVPEITRPTHRSGSQARSCRKREDLCVVRPTPGGGRRARRDACWRNTDAYSRTPRQGGRGRLMRSLIRPIFRGPLESVPDPPQPGGTQ